MHKSTGIWSKLSPIFNIIFLLHGLVVISFVSIFKWTDFFDIGILSLIKKIVRENPFDFFTSFEYVEYGLLAIGASITILSIIGFLTVKHGKRWSVIIYFVLLMTVFMSHVILLIIFFAKSSELIADIKDTIRIESKNLVYLADQSQEIDTFEGKCQNFYVLSQLFSCYGDQDSIEFNNSYFNQSNSTLIAKCCFNSDEITSGCTTKFDIIKEINMTITISNAVLVFYELLFIFMLLMIFKSIKRFEEKKFINETYLNFYDAKSYKLKQIEKADTNIQYFTSIFD